MTICAVYVNVMRVSVLKTIGLLAFVGSVGWARSAMTVEAYNQGVQLFNAGQFSEAVSYFDKAIDRDDDFADAYYARAICKRQSNNLEGALSDLNRTLQLKPDLIDAYAARGSVLYEAERWDNAKEDFDYVLEKRPRDAQALLGRGLVALKKIDYRSAERDLRKFVAVKPDDPLTPKIRQLLASLSRDTDSDTSEPSAQSAPPKSHVSAKSQRLADDLFTNSHTMSEAYSQKVMRGQNATAVGDIEHR
jgi:tetratricopeptide (TPR) repeat protein